MTITITRIQPRELIPVPEHEGMPWNAPAYYLSYLVTYLVEGRPRDLHVTYTGRGGFVTFLTREIHLDIIRREHLDDPLARLTLPLEIHL